MKEHEVSNNKKLELAKRMLSTAHMEVELYRNILGEFWIECSNSTGQNVELTLKQVIGLTSTKPKFIELLHICSIKKYHIDNLKDLCRLLKEEHIYKDKDDSKIRDNKLYQFLLYTIKNRKNLADDIVVDKEFCVCIKKEYVLSNIELGADDVKRYAQILKDKNILIAQSNRVDKQITVNGQRKRYFCLRKGWELSWVH